MDAVRGQGFHQRQVPEQIFQTKNISEILPRCHESEGLGKHATPSSALLISISVGENECHTQQTREERQRKTDREKRSERGMIHEVVAAITSSYLMTCGKQALASGAIDSPVLTALRPVLWRVPSAVCSARSPRPHCNAT